MDRNRVLAGWAALVALAALAVLSLTFVSPPAPLPADAPTDQFSAGRAYALVDHIGAKVHVAGSDAAADVRDYIVTTLTGLGLQTRIQDAVGADDALGGFAMAHVRNVIGVLPGTASTGRVFLVAHYDSVQVSYGGSDDGAGVATLLESARALAAGPRPRNDIVFVFTEAEEACLCGAEAFVSQDPLARDGGVALNFEARGSGGPAIMFETSEHNADVVRMYGSSVPYPVATSFAVEVYRILPNDTDFTLFRTSGRFTGLNAAYIDGSAVYHSPEDRPSYLDKRSLQHHGSNALALARAFGGADLAQLSKPSTEDSTYFPVLGLLARYPGWLVWPVAGLALVSVLALALVARVRSAATLGRTAAGFGLALVPFLLAAAGVQALWVGLVAVQPGYTNMIDPWHPGWFRLGVIALVATIVVSWYALLRRRIGAWPLAIGALGWLAALGLLLAAETPGGSYLAAIPALAGGIGAIVALLVKPWWARLGALSPAAAVAVLILAPTVLLFFPALGLATGGAAAAFAALLALALLPVLEWTFPPPEVRRRLAAAAPGLVAGLLAVVCLATGLSVDKFDGNHPLPTQLMYAQDADTGTAVWASEDTIANAWTSQYLTGRADLSAEFPILGKDVATGPAQSAQLPAPNLTVTADQSFGGIRTVTMTLTPQRSVRLAYLKVESGTTILRATVDGRAVPADAIVPHLGILFHAPPADGLVITLVVGGTGPLTLRAMDGSDGLGALPGFHARPVGVGVEGSHTSELVLVAKTYTV